MLGSVAPLEECQGYWNCGAVRTGIPKPSGLPA